MENLEEALDAAVLAVPAVKRREDHVVAPVEQAREKVTRGEVEQVDLGKSRLDERRLALPPDESETSRSSDHPPHTTATRLLSNSCLSIKAPPAGAARTLDSSLGFPLLRILHQTAHESGRRNGI